MKFLNIGCGSHFHPAWTNVDVASTSPHVIAHDIRKGLPFDGASFDVVYHSHVIEHLAQPDALSFMRECVRVLRPGGTIRVVTPDLETLARSYLDRLEAALRGDSGAPMDHYWMVLEIFDQMVRSRPGGEMGRYLARPDLENKEFIISRIGQEAKNFWDNENTDATRSPARSMTLHKIVRKTRKAWQETVAILAGLVSGKGGSKAFREGLFRNSGEIHRWLYDRFSLARLLEQAGLVEVRPCSAGESRIPDFAAYQLDVVQGRTRKPDSLFMEAGKPR